MATADKMADRALPLATSLPVTMLTHPLPSDSAKLSAETFVGELSEDFAAALARVAPFPPRSSLVAVWRWMRARTHQDGNAGTTTRAVAFDGFRSKLYDEKIERDRRYGTIYTVREAGNAYLVRLEMPRHVPLSALREAWGVSAEMPDYRYRLELNDQVLAIRASVGPEVIRRLAYISSSFPADFLTRIEFAQEVEGFVHRLANKILEVIAFKRASAGLAAQATMQPRN